MNFSINKISEWFIAGLIPGPLETEQEFLTRVQFCNDLRKNWGLLEETSLHFTEDDQANALLEESTQITLELFGIAPKWVPVILSDHQLTFWQGGCAWIFQLNESTPYSAFLQLRQTFKTHKRYLGLYERSELIAHEIAHVGRMLFEEPKFEEIIAYQTSKSTFRKFFGPIFRSATESMVFILVLAVTLLINFTTPSFYVFNLVPFFLVGYGWLRLLFCQRKFTQCQHQLTLLLSCTSRARQLTFCLTDKEIIDFASWDVGSILSYIDKKAPNEFRWKFLKSRFIENPAP